MLKENAETYVKLGEQIADAWMTWGLDEYFDKKNHQLTMKGEEAIRDDLRTLLDIAQRLKLTTSMELLDRRLGYADSSPQTRREFEIVVETFKSELSRRIFLVVPPHVAEYYEWDSIVSDLVVEAFPKASEEIRESGTCFATGQNTACVFHAMRAAEIGLRALGAWRPIKIKNGKPLELAEWREILDGLAGVASEPENLPNSTPNKDADLLFLSEAAAQFRFFKNGWRIRVAHARANYNEPKAKEAIDHVRSFFETLATRLEEKAA